MPAFWAAAEIRRQRDLFFISSLFSFLFCQITPYVPASGARPTQHHIYRRRHFRRAAGSLRLCRLPKGLANKKDQLLAQSVKGVDSQKAYTHINTYSIGVEREKVKA